MAPLSSSRAYGPLDRRQARTVCEVYTEEDLRRAIALFSDAADGATYRIRPGGMIIIAGSLRITRTVLIPAVCPGLTICSAARAPISPVGVIDSLFDVRAPLVTIRDLFVASRSATDMFTTFVTAGSSQPDLLRVLDNYVVADRVYVESATNDPNDVTIRGNMQSKVNASHAAPIVIHGGRARVTDNNLSDGGGDGITVGAGGDYCRIGGNDLRGADITTTASDGYNTVSANTQTGALTLHATDDALGGNT